MKDRGRRVTGVRAGYRFELQGKTVSKNNRTLKNIELMLFFIQIKREKDR